MCLFNFLSVKSETMHELKALLDHQEVRKTGPALVVARDVAAPLAESGVYPPRREGH